MRTRSNQQVVKQINKSLLLGLIHQNGPISRIELSRQTKLSPTTVSSLVEECIQEGIVHEVGKSGSGLGRKMKLLDIRGEAAYVLGADLSNSPNRLVLLNMKGEIVAKHEFERLDEESSIRKHLAANLLQFLENQQIDIALVKMIGISVPGRLDDTREIVIASDYLGMQDFPLKRMLEEALSIPVFLVNDLDAAGFAERFSGAARGKRNLVYILINYGVGAGLVLRDQIYHGFNGQAGRTPVLSTFNTLRVSSELQNKYPDELAQLETPEQVLDTFLSRVRDRIEPYFSYGEEIKEQIARFMAEIVQFINPEQLIVSGWITRCPVFFKGLVDRTDFYEKSPDGPTPIVPSYWEEYGAAVGAATLGLQKLLGMKKLL